MASSKPASLSKSFALWALGLVLCSGVLITMLLASSIIPRLIFAYTLPEDFQPVNEIQQGPASSSPTESTRHLWQPALNTRVDLVTRYPQVATTLATEHYAAIRLEANPAIEKALEEQVDVDFSAGMSLQEFAVTLAHVTGIPIQLDERVLAGELGLDVNEPEAIRGPATNLRLRPTLNRLLANVFETPLTFFIRDDVLLITDKQYAADNYHDTRIYPTPFDDDAQALIEAIQNTIDPTNWNTVGGAGAISPVSQSGNLSGLIISHSEEVHHQIEQLMTHRESLLGIRHGTTCLRAYTLLDPVANRQIATSLKDLCNTALGGLADIEAEVTTTGSKIFIRSSSRPFLVCAHQVLLAYQGVTSPEIRPAVEQPGLGAGYGSARGMPGGGMF